MNFTSPPLKLYFAVLGTALAAALAAPSQAADAGPQHAQMAGGPQHSHMAGGPHAMGGHGAMMGGPGMMFGGMLNRALDRVSATPEQRTQIQQIVERARTEMRAQHESGRALREQMLALFAQPTVDAKALEELRQKQLAQHDTASRSLTAAMLDISGVLTLQQRQQMTEYMTQRREMMQRHHRERQGIDGPKS